MGITYLGTDDSLYMVSAHEGDPWVPACTDGACTLKPKDVYGKQMAD